MEEEWIDTLSTIDPDDIMFEDFVEAGIQLSDELRQKVAIPIVSQSSYNIMTVYGNGLYPS